MVEVTVPHDASPQLYPTQKGHTGDTDLRTSESRRVSEKGPHETNPGQKLPPDYVRLTVTSQVYDVCKRTPLSVAAHLSSKLGYNVLLKRENEQPTFNCGLRGAYNMISQLDSTQICKGIITSGTDGHAEAVAHSARSLRIPAMIVMPESTSMEVQARFAAMKSVLVLHGADINEARDHCSKLSEANGLIEIPTSENRHVIAGYGTIAWEILRQKDLSDTDALFCPLGDGGVVAGIGAFMKRMAPNVKIISVQISTARRPIQKRNADRKLALPIRAVAVDHIGSETLRLCHEVVDEIVLVTMDEACAAIKDAYEETRSFLDPCGASALAGLKKWTETNEAPSSSRSLIAIIGSASATFDQIQSVTERVAMRESSEALLSLSIPHMPHSLADLVSLLAPHVITELVYRSVSGRTADVLVGLSLDTEIVHGQAVVPLLLEKLASAGMSAVDVSGNKLTASRIRYQAVCSSHSSNERVYALSLSGRSNALSKLLGVLSFTYDLTLIQHSKADCDANTFIVGIRNPNIDFERTLDKINCSWQVCKQRMGLDYAALI
ncbi:threonine ammonia-lyase, biosynthetic [Fusarium oxysporum f. sp. lycopersici MN25]|nr:threonine ammonia-lyase, biosynthetic [Fusarium oxysporum f. sp. lycopersici MN25]